MQHAHQKIKTWNERGEREWNVIAILRRRSETTEEREAMFIIAFDASYYSASK